MKFLRLILKAPSIFDGKTIEHNGINIKFNHDYKNEKMNEYLHNAMMEIDAGFKDRHIMFKQISCVSIENNIDLKNLPYSIKTDSDAKIWHNLLDLGFLLEHRSGFNNKWSKVKMIGYGWDYRISPQNTMTFEQVLKLGDTHGN